jgi:hypothetical protein
MDTKQSPELTRVQGKEHLSDTRAKEVDDTAKSSELIRTDPKLLQKHLENSFNWK